MVGADLGFSISGMSIRSDSWDREEWIIIPACEVLVDDEEWLDQVRETYEDDFSTIDDSVMLQLYHVTNNNGRLERDKEITPVLDEIRRVADTNPPDLEILRLLGNIPPLNKED